MTGDLSAIVINVTQATKTYCVVTLLSKRDVISTQISGDVSFITFILWKTLSLDIFI